MILIHVKQRIEKKGMHQDVLRFLLLTFETCSTELMMNYHAPAIA